MSTAYSYPGIYIQELPLSTQTITPAPTSITAFVGYVNPWQTEQSQFGQAVQLFSFSDYERYFGGLYTSGLIASDLARAVYAFFLNGGNNAWVVGLQPSGGGAQFGNESDDLAFMATVNPDSTNTAVGMLFQALEPADVVPMTVSVTNLRQNEASVYSIFDLVIRYGPQVEVYRGLDLTIAPGTSGSIDKVVNAASALVSVGALNGASYGTQFPVVAPATLPVPPAQQSFELATIPTAPNAPGAAPAITTTFSDLDFLPVFQQNSSLDNVEIFNLLLVPGVADNTIISAALAFAERKRAFAILDPPPQATAYQLKGSVLPTMDSYMNPTALIPLSQNGAIYFPYLQTTDPLSGLPTPQAPSGFVAGVYAATDASRGVWKAPAGIATTLLGTTGPVQTGVMNDMQQGVLNLDSINCLRSFASTGTVVYGARTLVAADTAFAQSKYVPVRRMTLFIEQSLIGSLKWVVFEPNDEPLWLAIKSTIEAFLLSLFNQQALQGSTPSDAFQVKVDSTTTTPADQQLGIVNIVVSVALLKPAEFVVIKIAQIAGQTS